jgi:hypothetical protein
MLRDLRAAGRVHNTGSPDDPVWIWRVGSHAIVSELRESVRLLIGRQPMTLEALVLATGARERQVRGALREVQRAGSRIVELKDDGQVRYMLFDRARRTRSPRRTKHDPHDPSEN